MIGKSVSHFRILEKLGEGGMGVVYKAEDERLKRIVALKFLHPESFDDEEQRLRFLREAQAAAALDHVSICTIYGINEDDGETFISMAYIEGVSLKELISSGPLSVADAAKITTQIASGLDAAHARRIYHCDINPANALWR